MSEHPWLPAFEADRDWLASQPGMAPWSEGCARLINQLDAWLLEYSRPLCREPVAPSHAGYPEYAERLWACWRHHWRQAVESRPDRLADGWAVADNVRSGRAYGADKRLGGDPFGDVVLAVAVRLGEERALRHFEEGYRKLCLASAATRDRRWRNDPDEVWLTFLELLVVGPPSGLLAKFTGHCGLRVWLRHMASRPWWGGRMRHSWGAYAPADESWQPPEAEAAAEAHEMMEGLGPALRAAVECLSPRLRDTLRMTFVDGLRGVEIARAMGVHPGAVGRLRAKALNELRSDISVRLAAEGIEVDLELGLRTGLLEAALSEALATAAQEGTEERSRVARARRRRETAAEEAPQAAARPADPVHFSVVTPAMVTAGRAFVLDFWAHLEGQREAIEKRAAADGAEVRLKSQGPTQVRRDERLEIRVRIPGFSIKPGSQPLWWMGEPANTAFVVDVPGNAGPGGYGGVASVRVAGVKIAEVIFTATVGEHQLPPTRLPATERAVRRAFASYASEDRGAVLGRIQGMQKVAPHLEVFVDVASLRSGELWRERLRQEIIDRDVLYLFWSCAASESDWVDWEWRCAWQARGVEFIDPVPLVSPKEVPPPKELADVLHFNDWMLAYLSPSR